MPHYAHTFGTDERVWEPLEDHLHAVADRAAGFAAKFGAAEWGRVAGLWHDVGKYQPAFQARLRDPKVQAPHAGVGAVLALQSPPLAFAIAGHHAGLANQVLSDHSPPRPLTETLQSNRSILTAIRAQIPPEFGDAVAPPPPAWLLEALKRVGWPSSKNRQPLDFFTRLLFSTLVDADRVETGAFYARAEGRVPLQQSLQYEPLAALRDRLDATIDAKVAEVSPTPLNRLRANVLNDCRAAAELAPGLFCLTVPTGGGKTLAAMSFALRHACVHDLDRVLVVIPFTSIIEQNARQYREGPRREPRPAGELERPRTPQRRR